MFKDYNKKFENIIAFLYPNLSRPQTSRFTPFFIATQMSEEKRIVKRKGKLFISIDRIKEGIDRRASVMLKNLPTTLTKEEVTNALKSICKINFIHVPTNETSKILGFAFVNVVHYKDVVRLYTTLNEKVVHNKKIEVCYSKVQGVKNLSSSFGGEAICY